MIRAVIFDMDGLMYDTEPLVEKCWRLAARHSRLTMTPQTLSALRSRNSADRENYLKSIFGDRIDYKRLERVMYKELHTILGDKGLPLKPGLWELLVYLKHNGYRMAVQTTNTSDAARWYLDSSGCTEFFDVVVAGRAVQHGKPEPDIYLKAAQQLELPPEECLVLEDSPAGIIGAHRAGCMSLMIPDMDPPTRGVSALSHGVVEDLEQVITFLRETLCQPEQMWPAVRNVVFDLGGVLVDFDPVSYLRERFTNKKLEDYLYQNTFGNKLWREMDAGLISRAEAERIMLDKARKDGRIFEMRTVLDEWASLLRTKEDTVALIRKLKANGAKVFYLSNIPKDVFDLLSQREFMGLFDGGVASYEDHLLKPEAAIYRHLLDKYGLEAGATVFFDDTPANVEAACELGIIGRHFHSAALAEKNLEGYQVL